MKILKNPVVVLICLVTIASCRYSKEYQVISTEKFALSVPSWVKLDDKLKPGAAVQYDNRYRNFYVIGEVVAKAKTTDSLSSFMNGNLSVLKKAMSNAVVSDSTEITLGGLKGVHTEIFGKMTGENIYFSEVMLEGKSNYYHISIWTRGEDRKLRYKEDINKILNSFKEN